jgi:(2Fe-2S) ferredoxin
MICDHEIPSNSAATPNLATKTVLVCQNRTCAKQGAAAVLAAFESCCPAIDPTWPAPTLPNSSPIEVFGCGCLGQCGNGPMVHVLPEQVWYWRVQPEEVGAIVRQHLIGGCPISAMLYPALHRF